MQCMRHPGAEGKCHRDIVGAPNRPSADRGASSDAVRHLSDITRAALADALPPAASVANPVDVLGDARSARYARALEIIGRDDGVDATIVLLTPQAMTDAEQTARSIVGIAHAGGKPVIASFMGGDAVAAGRALLDDAHVPVFSYPERAVRAMAALWASRRYLDGLGQ